MGIAVVLLTTYWIIPGINYQMMPSKDFTIYQGSAQIFNENEALEKFLDYPLDKTELILGHGCGIGGLSISYNFVNIYRNLDTEIKRCFTTDELCACENCTAYGTCIVNNKKEESNNIKFRVFLYDGDFEPISGNNVKTEVINKFTGEAKFDVIIDSLKGSDHKYSTTNSYHFKTTTYNKLDYDCEVLPKQNCRIKKYDVAYITDIEAIRELFSKWDLEGPPMSLSEFELFQLNRKDKKFEKIGRGNISNFYISGESPCSSKNPAVNPKKG